MLTSIIKTSSHIVGSSLLLLVTELYPTVPIPFQRNLPELLSL